MFGMWRLAYQNAAHHEIYCVATRTGISAMFSSFLAIFAALASVQVLLVVKLADFLTDGAKAQGARAIDAEVHGATAA